jgi:predicted MPP superfamily phosphohydrolase
MSLVRLRSALNRWFFRHFFSLLLYAISAAQWMFLWWLLWPQPTTPAVIHIAGIVAVCVINRRITGGRFARHHPRRAWRRAYDAFAFTSLFCSLFLLLVHGLGSAAQLFVATVAAAMPGRAPAAAAGLEIAFQWLGNGGVGLICFAFAYGYTLGQARLRVTRLRLPLRGYERLGDLRIAQITDIHVGQNLGLEQLESFVALVNRQDADLICITGDIADNAGSDLALFFPVLARLRARHGVIAILGNHDHYAGARRVEEALRQYTDFIVLRDEHVRLDIGGVPLHVIGLDDRGIDWARGVTEAPYLADTMAALPAGEAVLVLCHRPDIFRQSSVLGAGLTLSGHTHGGQIGLPWVDGRSINPARIVTPFDRGLFGDNGSYLYVNCGLGVTGQRVRLCTPREVLVVEVGDSRDNSA